ncbi:hypothetical protein L207DRAFT_639509 [Hyaloscypha variabilis F]|uniref:PHD-type domain-containing protein n=1 Tax=Hyaloscypha variabilis (strain UAMH 11265 / GT02V1 / F) TaxID=1149755 RepID=A0A2J6R4D6_HYAVF|nr:hypothetical protein L207DRAFT_639509 [Hyaloscypha variabilis F]
MASKEPSQKGGNKSCEHSRKRKMKCTHSELDPRTCIRCQETSMECSLSGSRTAPSADAKRKIEEVEDTPTTTNRASSSATASHNSHNPSIPPPPPKKPRQNKPAQPPTPSLDVSPDKKRNICSNACGICRKEDISSGETKGDRYIINCDIAGCGRWYHLSCVQFQKRGHRIFLSLATGTKDSLFFCPECFNPQCEDLVNAIAQAESDFQRAMERIKQAITSEKEGGIEPPIPSPRQEPDNSHAFEQDMPPWGMGVIPTIELEQATSEKYEGFQKETIESLLSNLEQAVYNYNRDIISANNLFLDEDEVLKWTPLKAWNRVDPGQSFVPGKEWFDVDGKANNLSESHAPITAALRQILRTPDDKPLRITADLKELSFSDVHTALINWFVFDILIDKLNIYHFPTMKPLRATLAAVSDFGESRWKGKGRQVVREVQLRAWHKDQFREEVIEKVGWQGELIRRLEEFLAPLTKKIGRISARSESRARIIRATVELWSYLDAAQGGLILIEPTIGGAFDGMKCEVPDGDSQADRNQNMKVKWVLRRGFTFQEKSTDGKSMSARALVITK